ncbi:uncharacterized protein B0P05DRAFT_568513 [Gilbertella persicaria]|uniref:uncharacterized protein n=1 Tax=Gilbertella persicaria TaxID=101096 RepID=UPI002220BA33|nr:uncharacterized protein B0P05DRAFT_568513 [Gilbertella persicaria]KAI8092351.1 hypothetical protein B0P05DRAFT_568513 [Gilbertella persicaria]
MATKRKGKTVPCEGCRERKKKCSAGQPCERCKKLGIHCHYLQPVSPPKTEYMEPMIDSHEIQLDIDYLQFMMNTMEREIESLRNQPRFIQDKTDQHWQLTLRDGKLSIDTHITSFTTLLERIKVCAPLLKQPTFRFEGGVYLKRQFAHTVLRKGFFKATLECVKSVEQRRLIGSIETPDIVLNKPDLLLQLIQLYFSCRFSSRVLFHKQTFYDLFISPYPDPESSPVLCALSAAVLVRHCKHIMAIVPFDQQLGLAEYYFNKARQIVSLRFDEPCLETMAVYLHMAYYMAHLLRPQEASKYLDMAARIRHILAETLYVHPSTPYAGEYETFKRLHAGLMDIVSFIQYIRNQRGVPLNKASIRDYRTKKTKPFHMVSKQRYETTPMPDEPMPIVRAIMKDHYIECMTKVLCPYFIRVRWTEDDMIPISLLIKTETELKYAYYHHIPSSYQLSPTIFEEGLSDADFKRRLSQDERCDLVSVTLAARFYQSLIALHEPFLPVIKRPSTGMDLSLLQEEQEETNEKKRKRTPTELPTVSEHALRAQHTTYQSAIIVVRLLEYQCTVLNSCTIPTASLLCAWDILMRNSYLGISDIRDTEYLSKKTFN